MRGKSKTKTNDFRFRGITPAYAGKNRDSGVVVAVIRDHPRLCGEKLETRHDFTEKLGSPPPMRGKIYALHLICVYLRITPAYAGKKEQSTKMKSAS